jgi:hypothetical protein
MKKLFIVFVAFALCIQPVYAMTMEHTKMETDRNSSKKKSSSSTCTLVAKVCCAVIFGGFVLNESAKAAQRSIMQQEWARMQKDCWDPCLPAPASRNYQEIKYEDYWRPRVWDTRINKYRDELNCPDQEQDIELRFKGCKELRFKGCKELRFKGCKKLEEMELDDEKALVCITGMEANGHHLTSTIIQQKDELNRRAIHRQECLRSPDYLEWKKEHHPQYKMYYSPCLKNSPYLSTQYQDNQPHVVDVRMCRFLRKSDCDRFSDVGTLVTFFSTKRDCEKLSDPEKMDGDEVSKDTITALINYRTSTTNETLCTIWRPELEKKNQ